MGRYPIIGGARWSRNRNFHSRLCRDTNSLFRLSLMKISRIDCGVWMRPVPINIILWSISTECKLWVLFNALKFRCNIWDITSDRFLIRSIRFVIAMNIPPNCYCFLSIDGRKLYITNYRKYNKFIWLTKISDKLHQFISGFLLGIAITALQTTRKAYLIICRIE